MLTLTEMRKLADGAQNVRPISREPVKTQFTADERRLVEVFFRSLPNRKLGSDRMRSFFAVCELLGEPLDSSNWHRLEKADKVKGGALHFLVGQQDVRIDPGHRKDWQLKCLGLKEVEPEVFVVGLNEIFYAHADAIVNCYLPKI